MKPINNASLRVPLTMAALLTSISVVTFIIVITVSPKLVVQLEIIKSVMLDRLATQSPVYLFYVGATFISTHYLRRRQWLRALLVFTVGLIWAATHHSTFGFIASLGTDSFHELSSFDPKEALFWIDTISSQFRIEITLNRLFLYNIIAFACLSITLLASHAFAIESVAVSKALIAIGVTFCAAGIYQSSRDAIMLFSTSSNAFDNVRENFSSPAPAASVDGNANVMLYIGESTSIMNMSIYGYHRKTTGRLEAIHSSDDLMIKFDNVLSTHTHTSPSLLEALSVDRKAHRAILPIHQKKRISIIDILNSAGVTTEVFSNQGQSGSWNQASSIIFKNAKNRTFSIESRLLGNSEHLRDRPWDHAFFAKHITAKRIDEMTSSLIVFHSYAGHGDYAKNIPPEFRKPVDYRYKNAREIALTAGESAIQTIEDYDSAINYVDYAVSKAIEVVKKSKQPWIFIYFSDHGESVFTNRGHDSARFTHEMARVPLILFFNPAARAQYPALYEKYKRLSASPHVTTLAQLPATVLDLLGVNVVLPAAIASPIGSLVMPEPIVVRETSAGITAVNLASTAIDKSTIDEADDATRHFVFSRRAETNRPISCYHRSNTLAKALRGQLVANCLEIDIVISQAGEVFALHPPAENTGLTLQDIMTSTKKADKIAFWLDGKNLTSEKSCRDLKEYLARVNLLNRNILIEFPTGSHRTLASTSQCVQQLKSFKSIHRSYYVPTAEAVQCAKDIDLGEAPSNSKACGFLRRDLSAAIATGIYSDLSFDFAGFNAIKSLSFGAQLKWNAWNVDFDHADELDSGRFRMIIPKTNDPNSI
jgi:glucan phosphoethanolaminetransferase (alkaline phosphatase superfamily)